MERWKAVWLVVTLGVATLAVSAVVLAAVTPGELVDICEDLYGGIFPAPNSEPLGAC